jgi:hypothetical protein
VGFKTLTVTDTVTPTLTSTATLTVSPKGGTAILSASGLTAGDPSGAPHGTLNARPHRRAAHWLVADRHRGAKIGVPIRAEYPFAAPKGMRLKPPLSRGDRGRL